MESLKKDPNMNKINEECISSQWTWSNRKTPLEVKAEYLLTDYFENT